MVPVPSPDPLPPPAPLAADATAAPSATAAPPETPGAAGAGGTSVAAALPPSTGRKGQGGKKGKGPARKAPPPEGRTSLPSAAPPSAAALPSPAAPSTSSGGASAPLPRAYAQVAAPRPATASSSAPAASSSSISSGRGPFSTLTRKHGVRCLLVPASPHVETYVRALARVVGPSAIVAASKMFGKVVFFLASEAAAQEAVERGLAVGGVYVPLEPLEDLGVRVVLTSVPPFLPNAALLPFLSTLGKPISVLSPLPLGCKDPALRHVLSFRRQVQLQLPPAVARDGGALEGSFLVPYQGAHYRVHYSSGEARCFLCRAMGHVRRDCPLARHGGAPGPPEAPAGPGPTTASSPGCPAPVAAPPPLPSESISARDAGVAPPSCPGERPDPVAPVVSSGTGPVGERAPGLAPGLGEGLPQGEVPHPLAALSPPLGPLISPPLPPDPGPAGPPSVTTLEGWVLVGEKRSKRKKARHLPAHSDGEEAPRKSRKGAVPAEPSAAPPDDIPQVAPVVEAVAAARRSSSAPILEAPLAPLPAGAAEGDASATLLASPPVADQAAPGVAEGDYSSIFAEIESLGLTPVTQGEDDPLPPGLDLGGLMPALPLPPSPLPQTAVPALELPPPDAPDCLAVAGLPSAAAEPLEATASAEQPGPGASEAGQLSLTPPGGPDLSRPLSLAGAVGAEPVLAPGPSVAEGPPPDPTPLTPELGPEESSPGGAALGAPDPHPAPASVPDPAPGPDSVPAPDFVPVPPLPSSRIVPAPGDVPFPLPSADSQGAGFESSLPSGAAVFPLPPPLVPGVEAGGAAPVPSALRRGSAPCLPVSVGHGAAAGPGPEDGPGSSTPAPTALRAELRTFLANCRGARNRVQLALQRWGDFHLVLQAVRALLREGKGTGRRDAASYRRALSFRASLLAFGVGHGLLGGLTGPAGVPASEDPPQPSSWPQRSSPL
ncbi:proline-rich protein 36-like [Emydura macquarii macquarii]|uniref:proline-rich protein 36-like n=1 Tax=Emydura macquarii macquarii TaxID=1129001 RepID=UPI00352AA801